MDELLQRTRELIHELVQTNIEKWTTYGFLTFRWWILLALLIVPWIVWIKIADKTRTLEIVLVGTFVIIVSTILDWTGYYLDFWDYPIELMPIVPGALPFDFSVIPVAYMLLYQYCKTWKSYCLGLVCMTVIYAFIGEPLANRLQFVLYIKWSNVYSTGYYVIVGIAVRAVVDKLKGLSGRSHPY